MVMALNVFGEASGSKIGARLAVSHFHLGIRQRFAISMREKQNRLGEMMDFVSRQTRLVVVDQRDDISPGDVAMIDDRKAGGLEFQRNRVDLAPDNRRPHGSAVQHPRKCQIVDVTSDTGDLVRSFFAKNVAADGAAT